MIEKFITQVKTRGLARSNRYDVVIPFPEQTIDNFRGATEIATLFCENATLPGVSISTTPARVFGESREMPYEKIFDPVTFTFYLDAEMRLRTVFDRWMGLVVDPKTRTMGYYNDYVKDINIYVRTVEDEAPFMITLFEAYPKIVSSATLDAAGRDLLKMSVTMQYKYWHSYQLATTEYAEYSSLANRTTQPGTFDPPRSIITAVPPELQP